MNRLAKWNTRFQKITETYRLAVLGTVEGARLGLLDCAEFRDAKTHAIKVLGERANRAFLSVPDANMEGVLERAICIYLAKRRLALLEQAAGNLFNQPADFKAVKIQMDAASDIDLEAIDIENLFPEGSIAAMTPRSDK